MNRYRTYLTFFFLLATISLLSAQPKVQMPIESQPDALIAITGKVVDEETKLPLEFTTITLFSLKDSSMVTGAISEPNGSFLLEAKPGLYYARFEFISYKPFTVERIELDRKTGPVDLGTISMKPDASTLAEVEVRAEKSTMQLSLDKRVFNVGKDLANSGGTAADVLDNVPSVTVDVEGNVELRGAGGVRILVDGKPSGLIGISNSDGLRQLPANMIERVEVITNPSARYEAEGMSGIINIVLKKERSKGINGAFDLTLGNPDEYGAAFSLNYRKDRFNFFTNYSIRYRKGPGEGNQYQEFYDGDTTLITENESRRNRGGLSNNVRFGADYFFNEKTILTTALNYRYSNDDNFARITYRDYINNRNNLVGITTRTDDEIEKEPNLEYSLTLKKLFQEKDHELTVDFRYQDEEEDESSEILEQSYGADGTPSGKPDLQQRSNNVEGQRNFIFQMDYTKPFGEEGRVEAGLRSGIRNVRNDFLVEEVQDGEWVPLEGFNNNLLYDEDIHAAYTSVGTKINRFSWQAGLRAEYSKVRTELIQTEEVNPRDYLNVFPSVFLGYELPGENSFQISYSRRIRRPSFWELNPFFTFSDARNIWGGNPDLDPEYTNSFELGHLKYFTKGSMTSSVYYRHTDGVIERIRQQTSDTSSVTRPLNLATEDSYGVEFTWSYDPVKNWRLNGNLNFYRSITEGQFGDQELYADTYTWFGRLSSRVTLFKNLDFQVNFNYRAPRNTTQGRSLAVWHVDPAASMDILNKKGTITLSVRDLFNTRRRQYFTEGENFYVEGDWQWRARQVTLTMSYRLNQNKRQGRRGEGGGFEGGDGGEF